MIAFTLLALFALTGAQSDLKPSYKCPENYELYNVTNECHNFVKTKVTWEDANAACVIDGGYLARIYDSAENTYLSDLVGENEFWIGLNDQANSGTYLYSPAPETSHTYFNWYKWRISFRRDCIAVKTNGEFDLRKCNDDGTKYYYVCEKKAIKTFDCPESWESNDKINACYKIFEEAVAYGNASATCETEGAHLYFPTTHSERDFVNDLVQTDHWIGINDMQDEGDYVTSSGQQMEYGCWCPLNPTDKLKLFPTNTNDCVVMYFGLCDDVRCFNDIECTEEHPYICKMIY